MVFYKDLNLELSGGDLKFGISFKEITTVGSNGKNYTLKSLPKTNVNLNITVNIN